MLKITVGAGADGVPATAGTCGISNAIGLRVWFITSNEARKLNGPDAMNCGFIVPGGPGTGRISPMLNSYPEVVSDTVTPRFRTGGSGSGGARWSPPAASSRPRGARKRGGKECGEACPGLSYYRDGGKHFVRAARRFAFCPAPGALCFSSGALAGRPVSDMTFAEFIDSAAERLKPVQGRIAQRQEFSSDGAAWWFTFTRAGVPYRFLYDRRASTLTLERSQGSFVPNSPGTWRALETREPPDTTLETALEIFTEVLGRFGARL